MNFTFEEIQKEKKRIRVRFYVALLLSILALYFIGMMSMINMKGADILKNLRSKTENSENANGTPKDSTEFSILEPLISLGENVAAIAIIIPKIFSDQDEFYRFLFKKEYSSFVYIIMVFLLANFLIIIFNRQRYLNNCLEIIGPLEQKLFSKEMKTEDKDTLKKSFSELKAKHTVFERFLFEVYKFTKDQKDIEIIKEAVIDDELETYDLFMESVNKSLVWIIRLGIIGTLWGIMIAFYEVAEGIGKLTDGEEMEAFQESVNNALEGNAIAVVTSLAAHLVTLIIEFFISKSFTNKHYNSWIKNKSITLKNYHRKGLLEQPLDTVNAKVSEVEDEFDKAMQVAVQLGDILADFDLEKTRNLNMSLNNLEQDKKKMDEISKEINDAHTRTKNFVEYINDKMDAIKITWRSYLGTIKDWCENTIELIKKSLSKNEEGAKNGQET